MAARNSTHAGSMHTDVKIDLLMHQEISLLEHSLHLVYHDMDPSWPEIFQGKNQQNIDMKAVEMRSSIRMPAR